ncbi:MAG: GNAT family N-acetyltransferase [Flavobacteriales bacterium]|nr:GNAT family N-acetyltransferase [Flavobacteriales bacterium]
MPNSESHIAPPVPREVLRSELNEQTFIRRTNKGNNEIYIVNCHNSPNVLHEIGRLRELTFTRAGGGTGKPVDLDEFDLSENCYSQLIVYAPEEQEIIGGYRFIDCSRILNIDPIPLSTAHYFNFSPRFIEEYLPYTIELGRSWIQPLYQSGAYARKGIFALDNLWDGLGAISVDNPHIRHYFGKVTMYPSYDQMARDAVLLFMRHYFGDPDQLVQPIHPLQINPNPDFMAELNGLDYKEGHKVLGRFVKQHGEHIPPLINSYMSLSPTMKSFGTALNPDFGGVEETGILVTIADIYDEKKERHVVTYTPKKKT